MIRICFVCLGNICRSPTAEGIMLQLVEEAGLGAHVAVDSAGTAAHHVGERADARSRRCARARGVELRSRARQFGAEDFARFDYVLAMDRDNHADLIDLAPDAVARRRVSLLLESGASGGDDVPDPYYGGPNGFDDVFDLCEAACRDLLARVVAAHGLDAS